jgi:rhamnogalacturonyl hydrolase YesR
MEESAYARICKALSSIINVFIAKKPEIEMTIVQAINEVVKPHQEQKPVQTFVDEKVLIEKANFERNAIESNNPESNH